MADSYNHKVREEGGRERDRERGGKREGEVSALSCAGKKEEVVGLYYFLDVGIIWGITKFLLELRDVM